jgi:hypothetical protein
LPPTNTSRIPWVKKSGRDGIPLKEGKRVEKRDSLALCFLLWDPFQLQQHLWQGAKLLNQLIQGRQPNQLLQLIRTDPDRVSGQLLL